MSNYRKTEKILYSLGDYMAAVEVNKQAGEDAVITDTVCKKVNFAINVLDAEDAEIIDMYYKQGLPIKYIAKRHNVDISTMSRRKKKIVNRLSVLLFPDDYTSRLKLI